MSGPETASISGPGSCSPLALHGGLAPVDDLHENVAKFRDMDGDEIEEWFAREMPKGLLACETCQGYLTWIRWSLSEPTALQSFLWKQYDAHVDMAGEAAWNG